MTDDDTKLATEPALTPRRRPIAAVLFGGYALFVILVVFLSCVLALALTPGLQRRRRIVRVGARAAFAAAGIPLRIRHLEHLDTAPCIVVANHSSYLDGIILTAALPARFGFVIKREVTRIPVMHFLLRRIGSEFVERSNRQTGARDARRLCRKAQAGHALAFFPEGTFTREPGLRRFHAGAFAAAARAGIPVIPIVIRGSRDILPAESWLPRRGRIDVIARPAVRVESTTGRTTQALRHASRLAILEYLDEPDLVPGRE